MEKRKEKQTPTEWEPAKGNYMYSVLSEFRMDHVNVPKKKYNERRQVQGVNERETSNKPEKKKDESENSAPKIQYRDTLKFWNVENKSGPSGFVFFFVIFCIFEIFWNDCFWWFWDHEQFCVEIYFSEKLAYTISS